MRARIRGTAIDRITVVDDQTRATGLIGGDGHMKTITNTRRSGGGASVVRGVQVRRIRMARISQRGRGRDRRWEILFTARSGMSSIGSGRGISIDSVGDVGGHGPKEKRE